MKKSKKIAIYLPYNDEKKSRKEGFLSKKEVEDVEIFLRKSKELDFFGNVDFKNVRAVDNTFSCGDVQLEKIDLFFWYAPGIKKVLDELKALAQITKVSKSPQSLELVADKFLSHSILKANGLPVPEFAVVGFDDLDLLSKIIKKWKTVLIKPRLGSFGRGIIKVSDFETLRDIAGILKVEHKQENIFIEKFYQNDNAKWISTTIINGKVAYGYRKSKEKFSGWKVYDINRNGGGAYYVDPEPVKEMAEKAARILDTSIVGFDFIKTKEGYKLVDENNFPGFYKEAFAEAGKNVSELITELILLKSKNESVRSCNIFS